MVTTPYYTGQDFGPKEGMAYTAVMPQEGFKYVYDQEGTRYSIPTTFNVSSGGGYTSLYKEDPIAAELEAGIQGTDVYQGSPYALANVPEFEGLKYSTPDYNRYQDLYGLYLGGGFDAAQDTAQIPGAVDTLVNVGGGGGGTGGTTTGGTGITTGVNTPEQQRLIDEGIGVQAEPGAPVSAPGEGMLTQEAIDDLADYPINTEYKSPYATGDANIAEQIAAEDRIAKARADEQAAINREQYMTGEYTPTETYIGTGRADLLEAAGGEAGGADAYFEDDLMDYDEHYDMDMETMGPYEKAAEDTWKDIQTHNTVAGNAIYGNETIGFFSSPGEAQAALEAYAAKQTIAPASQALDDEYYEFDTPPTTDFPEPVDFQQGFIDAKDYSAPGTLADPMEKQDFVTEEDMANPSKLLQRLGLPADFDLKRAAVEAGLNLAIGMPITILARMLPDGGIHPSTNLARDIGLLEGSNTATQDKYGISTQTSFDPVKSTQNYNEYNVERVEKLEDSMEKSKARHISKHGSLDAKNEYNMTWAEMNKRNLQELEDRNEYLTVSGVGGDVEGDQPGMTIAEDIALQNRIDAGIEAADEEPGTMIDDQQAIIPYGPMTEGDIEVTGLGNQEILDELAAEEAAAIEQARAEAAAAEQREAQRVMQEQIAAAERQEAARVAAAEQRASEQAAAQRAMQEQIAAAERAAAAARAAAAQSYHGGGADHGGGGSAPGTGSGASGPAGGASSGGGYSRGDYGGRGHHWAKGGRVRYSEGGIVSLKNAKR